MMNLQHGRVAWRYLFQPTLKLLRNDVVNHKALAKTLQYANAHNVYQQFGIHTMSLDTLVVSARPKKNSEEYKQEPVAHPICHSTIYEFDTVEDFIRADHDHEPAYSRDANPTTSHAEFVINTLEGGEGCLLFNSGLAAVTTTLLTFLKQGDHIVMQKPTYVGVEVFIRRILVDLGIEVSYVDAGESVESYRKEIKPNTKMFYGETPCNPNLLILDLEEFGKLGQETNILTFVDGTFASPYLQQPIKYGVDISMHSCTKYVGGHSDVLAGCVTTRTRKLYDLIIETRISMGSILNAHTASLLARSLKTLALRMKTHSKNGMRIAQFLDAHPKVLHVAYPGLKAHPGHETAKKQMSDFSGMITFEVDGGKQAAITLIESMKLVSVAVSLGGVKSNSEHPASMSRSVGAYSTTFGHMSVEAPVPDGSIRLSVGVEDVEDLIADITQGLEKL